VAETVLAIEPNPACLHMLHNNCAANGAKNVRIVPPAASDNNGNAVFCAGCTLGSGSLNMEAIVKCDQNIVVQTRKLDSLLEILGVASVDLMEVDVEGAEERVLKGLFESLRHGIVRR
jgi:FkbM family methyltransferase